MGLIEKPEFLMAESGPRATSRRTVTPLGSIRMGVSSRWWKLVLRSVDVFAIGAGMEGRARYCR